MAIKDFSKTREYITSQSEMNRRKRAFATLVISTWSTLCLFSLKAIIAMPKILLPILIVVALILSLLIVGLNKTLDQQAYLKIHLSDTELEWKYKDAIDSYSLADITSIRIKRTTKGTVREIRMGINRTKYRYINGLEDFEKFAEDLTYKVENKKVIQFKEPIDFDHPLFYVVVGILVGIGTTSLFKMLAASDQSNLKYVHSIMASYLVFTGLFFLINKPVRGRYGNQVVMADYVCGFICFAISTVIIIF